MIDSALLALFIPTFFVVSITPGMCMTLAMTLGMSVGVRTTMWMMWGELIGVAVVAISAVIGVSQLLLTWPSLFVVIKVAGGCYLLWLAFNMWQSKGKLSLSSLGERPIVSKWSLFNQGLITAIANPKGWAFMLSLLPPFINQSQALTPQLTLLVVIILLSEFVCMMLYATGGRTIAKALTSEDSVKRLNKLSASLMALVAVWLLLG